MSLQAVRMVKLPGHSSSEDWDQGWASGPSVKVEGCRLERLVSTGFLFLFVAARVHGWDVVRFATGPLDGCHTARVSMSSPPVNPHL
jgi:hypothetical protein